VAVAEAEEVVVAAVDSRIVLVKRRLCRLFCQPGAAQLVPALGAGGA